MEAKDSVGYEGCHGEVVEGVGEVFPDVGVSVFS